MSLGDSMKKLIGIEEYDDDDEITDAEIDAEKEKMEKQEVRSTTIADRPRAAAAPSKTERRFSMTNSGEFKLILIEPKTFETGRQPEGQKTDHYQPGKAGNGSRKKNL